MYTLGYAFKPWREAKAIADGPSILNYVRETADENGVDRHIRFGHKVKRASWSSETATWTVEAEHDGQTVKVSCNFLSMCSGYYATTPATRPTSRASSASRAGSSTRSTGPRTSTTPARRSW
jgi:cation diffusion facilitator CzcD-associated flavoprotein CzcO